jgi:hypothetical protein
MQVYVRLVQGLVGEGMSEKRAITLVAGAYGLDWHVLQIVYRHYQEVSHD